MLCYAAAIVATTPAQMRGLRGQSRRERRQCILPIHQQNQLTEDNCQTATANKIRTRFIVALNVIF